MSFLLCMSEKKGFKCIEMIFVGTIALSRSVQVPVLDRIYCIYILVWLFLNPCAPSLCLFYKFHNSISGAEYYSPNNAGRGFNTDENTMTKTVTITLTCATLYMFLVIGLMVFCKIRRAQKKARLLAEATADGKQNGFLYFTILLNNFFLLYKTEN